MKTFKSLTELDILLTEEEKKNYRTKEKEEKKIFFLKNKLNSIFLKIKNKSFDFEKIKKFEVSEIDFFKIYDKNIFTYSVDCNFQESIYEKTNSYTIHYHGEDFPEENFQFFSELEWYNSKDCVSMYWNYNLNSKVKCHNVLKNYEFFIFHDGSFYVCPLNF